MREPQRGDTKSTLAIPRRSPQERQSEHHWARRVASALLFVLLTAASASAQKAPPAATDAATALTAALSAACKEDAPTFATYLTSENSTAFLSLVGPQQIAFMKRMVQLDDPGHPLISTADDGQPVLRCETPSITTEMRFGPAKMSDNLAFIPITLPSPGEDPRTIRFGLVRDQGQWKLLSLGLVLLDVQALTDEWARADVEAVENDAVDNLRQIATALDSYRQAFGILPDSLAQLGPAPANQSSSAQAPPQISPDAANLIDSDLASGEKGGYKFRYRIVPSAAATTTEDQNKLSGYELAATPVAYGKSGTRSFFLDSTGALRGADKKGAVAGPGDPRIDAGSDAQTQQPAQP
ncbi:MAG: hypothetical protein WA871_09515 [Candidatus Acidiferrales bacterium]